VEELRPLLLLLARLPVLVRGRLAALVALLPLLLEAVGLEAPPALLALRRPAVHQVEVVLLRAARSALQAGQLAAYGRRARSVRACQCMRSLSACDARRFPANRSPA
jgi:hypothetical protein